MDDESEFWRWTQKMGPPFGPVGNDVMFGRSDPCRTYVLPECAPGTTFTFNGQTWVCMHEVHRVDGGEPYTEVYWDRCE